MENRVFGSVRSLTPTVKTTHGWVRGENRRGVAVFRGIPYGCDVSGKNRFLPASPARDWEGVRDCVPFGPVCHQRGTNPKSVCGTDFMGPFFSGGDPVFWQNSHDEVMAEECLVLNVQTPGIDDKKRPVLVYIHGGGFACGASDVMMGTPTLEAEEDIVVVGINHRLNVYGFLYLGDFDEKYRDSGIAGMLDVIMALEWVRDNVAAFGGDPGNVTIMGESGGGSKCSMLMAMPAARGLFHKAIVESGSFPLGIRTPAEAAEKARAYLDRLGIGTDELDKLLEVPPEVLSDTAWEMGYEPEIAGDGRWLAYNPRQEYPVYPGSEHIPTIIGMSAEEFGLFNIEEIKDITWETLPDWVARLRAGGLGGGGMECPPERIPALIEAVKTQAGAPITPQQAYLRIQSLCTFGCNVFEQTLTRARDARAPVWSYLVTYAGPWPRNHPTAWHTQDLALQFRVVLDPESEPLSRTLGHAWAAFCRTGSPSTEELLWPPYTPEGRLTMLFDQPCRLESDPLALPRKVLMDR